MGGSGVITVGCDWEGGVLSSGNGVSGGGQLTMNHLRTATALSSSVLPSTMAVNTWGYLHQ